MENLTRSLSEHEMKLKGEDRVWKTILSKSGSVKTVSQTQIGQQLVMKDAIRLLPYMRQWVEEGSSKIDRKVVKEYFVNDDFLLQKIVEVFLMLSSTSHIVKLDPDKVHIRHKDIHQINSKILMELSFDQSWRFTEVLVEASEHFTVDSQRVVKGNSFLTSIRYTCSLPEVILESLADKAHEAFFSEPMLVQPKDWTFIDGKLEGGYHHYEFQLVRARFYEIDYSLYSQAIFDSVNYIQSTSWKVNTEVLRILKRDLKMPVKEDFIKHEYPVSEDCEWDRTIDKDDPKVAVLQAARKVHFEKAELYNGDKRDFESAVGKYRAIRLAIGIAERYSEEENLYFPHSFDFRGRVYPIPIGLSPQGSDGVKAILEYSEGEVLTPKGLQWAWAYLTSLYGEDKISFDKRVIRGKELLTADYREADEPYQFLAHQLELQKLVENPFYEFKGRVHLDACNSGSQFTSSMTGDVAGCLATNVIPSPLAEDGDQPRQDAYLLVADKSLMITRKQILLAKGEELENLRLLESLLVEQGRKICKTPVMVSNYGGTAGGRADIIWHLLRGLGVDRKFITKQNASLYSKIIGDAITGVLNGGKAFETYIHCMNNIIAKQNKPVVWDTSDGFHVVHLKKKELKPTSVQCFLPGVRKSTTIIHKNFSEDVNSAKMKSAISPNYVHSLDAELLRRVALKMSHAGIEYSDFIHDSFGCHPNYVDDMLLMLKEEFRDLMKSDPLKMLDTQLREQVGDDKANVKAAEAVAIPCLGALNHDNVMASDWFFS